LRAALLGAVALCAGLRALPARAEALVLDFEAFSEGAPFGDRFLPADISMTVLNNGFGPNTAIVFDSACPDGCSGNDPDLQTPGAGAGNDVAQNHVLIIAENVKDTRPADGAVDDPDDEQAGGSIRFFFDPPRRVASLRVIDVDSDEKGGFAQVALADGGFDAEPLAPLGDNSAQTVVFAGAPLATSLRIFLAGSGAIDDIVIDQPPPSSTTSLPDASTTLPDTSTTSVPGPSTTTETVTTTTTDETTTTTIVAGVCGDVTGDGRVTATDASAVLNGAVNARFACPTATCDLDASGTVDVSDALAALRLAVGLPVDSICEPGARERGTWD
jgi:hypothetical protein